MFDVVTFGSATRDIFARSQNLKFIDCAEFSTGKALAVGAGAKIKIDELIFATGGGGTNTAATFALQGLATAYVGLVGDDNAGRELIKEMEKYGMTTYFMKITNQANTACGIILSSGNERSILFYPGVCNLLTKEDIDWNNLKAEWFYIPRLAGESSQVFEPLINFAKENNIKLAVNPGEEQLTKDLPLLKKVLSKIDILIVNQEEASQITGIDYKNELEIFKKFDELVNGIAVMTKGKDGVTVSDGKNIYRAGIPASGYVDRTGSGDAFGSGFVSVIIRGGTIEEAIQLGTANATATIQQIGAKNGLLKKGEVGDWEAVSVNVQSLKS